jgi:cobalt/nickel transport system permease protein
LLLLYRYAFVLGAEVARLATARRLRSAGRRPSLHSYAPLLGQLLLRALQRAQRVHQAMLARGFDGTIRSLRQPHWQARDTVFVLGWCSAFAALRAFDLPQWLGGALLACCP